MFDTILIGEQHKPRTNTKKAQENINPDNNT